jgi:hypothetical protein
MTKSDDKTKFSQMIERIAVDQKITHIEAIVNYCEETGLEIEMTKTLVNASLKKKLEQEAMTLRYIKGKSDALPID